MEESSILQPLYRYCISVHRLPSVISCVWR